MISLFSSFILGATFAGLFFSFSAIANVMISTTKQIIKKDTKIPIIPGQVFSIKNYGICRVDLVLGDNIKYHLVQNEKEANELLRSHCPSLAEIRLNIKMSDLQSFCDNIIISEENIDSTIKRMEAEMEILKFATMK